jgi:hypothetical protein
MTNPIPTPIPNPQSPIPGPRTRANRANARHSTGPRTEPGKQRSSLNALRHGLPRPTDPDGTSRGTEIQERSKGVPATARTALLPTEDPEAYQRHIQQFLDEYAPANPTETQLVHEIANTAWRLARQFQKALEQLRDIQEERRHIERRHLNEAADLLIRHQRRGLPWDPENFSSESGFVFSKQQVERHAQPLIRLNPAYYAPPAGVQRQDFASTGV